MRRITLGVLSLVGAAALVVACGDDEGGTPGSGGTSNNGGAAGASGNTNGGNAGAAGANTGGTAGGGTAGNAGAAGGGPGPDLDPIATCTGCVELIAPVTGPNDNSVNPPINQQDQVSFIFTIPAPGGDFSNGVVTWRIQALETNANLTVNLFAQNGAPGYAGVYPVTRTLAATDLAVGTWTDVVLDLSQYEPLAGAGGDAGPPPAADAGDGGGALLPNNGFNKAAVAQYGITLGINNTTTGSAVVRVAVDSVTITGAPGQTTKTFDAGVEGLAINQYQVPTGTPAPVHHP